MRTASQDDNNNIVFLSIIGAISSLAIAMGIGRFAYSALLPGMLSEHILSQDQAAILAVSNYAGYLLGSFVGMISFNERIKKTIHVVCMALSILTTFAMSIVVNYKGMVALRFISGISSACIFVLTSFFILRILLQKNRTHLSGIAYSGVGLGMLISSLCIIFLSSQTAQWQWATVALTGAILFIPATYWIFYAGSPDHAPGRTHSEDPSTITPILVLLTLAYFLEGLGYIINGTFLVAWVDSASYFPNSSQVIWIVVALAAIPSCVIWIRLAHRFHFLSTLIFAYFVQSFGIYLTTLNNFLIVLIGSAFFGATFMGITALTISAAKMLSPRSSAATISMLTFFYGVGQSLGPLLSTSHILSAKSYYSLILGSSLLIFAAGTLLTSAYTLKTRFAQ